MWLEKWDPFKEFERLHDEVNRVFNETLLPVRKGSIPRTFEGKWFPSVDIYEDSEKIELKAELPGMKPDEIDINIEGNTLTIKGERKFEHEEKKENYLRIERSYGTFCRSFSLPEYVEAEKIKADYKNGILDIVLPKKPEIKPKKVKVEVK